jgi:hypothetical protein
MKRTTWEMLREALGRAPTTEEWFSLRDNFSKLETIALEHGFYRRVLPSGSGDWRTVDEFLGTLPIT